MCLVIGELEILPYAHYRSFFNSFIHVTLTMSERFDYDVMLCIEISKYVYVCVCLANKNRKTICVKRMKTKESSNKHRRR